MPQVFLWVGQKHVLVIFVNLLPKRSLWFWQIFAFSKWRSGSQHLHLIFLLSSKSTSWRSKWSPLHLIFDDNKVPDKILWNEQTWNQICLNNKKILEKNYYIISWFFLNKLSKPNFGNETTLPLITQPLIKYLTAYCVTMSISIIIAAFLSYIFLLCHIVVGVISINLRQNIIETKITGQASFEW